MTHDRQADRERVAREWCEANGLPNPGPSLLKTLVDFSAAREAAVLSIVLEELKEHFLEDHEVIAWIESMIQERKP
jgi:hypothetical protein